MSSPDEKPFKIEYFRGYLGDILGISWGPLVHLSIGPLVPCDHWTIGPWDHWSIGPLVNHSISPLVHWSIGPNVNKVKLLSERTSGVPPVIFVHINVYLEFDIYIDSFDSFELTMTLLRPCVCQTPNITNNG